jgi:hypothetical protein
MTTRLTERTSLLLSCSGWSVLLLCRSIPRSAGIRRERVSRLRRWNVGVDYRLSITTTLNVSDQLEEARQIISHLSQPKLCLEVGVTTDSKSKSPKVNTEW